ncbi:hypothetical protein RHSIM_Rhsim02G0011100 [Rhododendron simsii]|uniref:Uncharacterized protein n=1 Tax=Rhododendron simsii TaxID=118357 RepID=A0A834LT87_RHOSS|nr:hypothetical protein RHSIM_Rhsim02G0011100 [Rhododendron simsii]
MAISETTHKFLKFEEGWPLVQEGIKKAVEIAEGVRSDRFTAEESMRLYTYPLLIFFPIWVYSEKNDQVRDVVICMACFA